MPRECDLCYKGALLVRGWRPAAGQVSAVQ